MIIMIDNKDSFTYNIVDYLTVESESEIKVLDSKELTLSQLKAMQPSALVISPGPGRPSDYPVLRQILEEYEKKIPILGVCLGFQFLIEHYGGNIVPNFRPVHGHTTCITNTGEGIFEGLPTSFEVMRYHSLMADAESVPNVLKVTATNDENIVMGIQHKQYPIYGVQYHPESILSEYGHEQIRLFLQKAGEIVAS
ncbi:anthranilate synthase component II [Staphylococcus carnosus]|uniref:Glutamine amidotransferase class-I protein n=1 Tax=Staphylococcus carnosus (strain TM300) TaxID=396513 RepID=B9DK42_STACT|nr:aminodeoxychorismate/anthranilate synthase component II [Staphylococcus carnosus]QPT03458.1 aminodeoxychorismate/anthranilate synthase component II [Staphylococcus carnosus]UQA66181.1 aminodeoxychorismate/anthranilate synthase component II [Staphylococcus carnosus]UTB78981.1 anthranilate synthase component II [Staphylococcus carnosus]UTB88534.1 anthranilate synthase component II [Staphylococcus carnosus]UTB90882.1 anthranilate synthase component II [Staphylococcus carnosus]